MHRRVPHPTRSALAILAIALALAPGCSAILGSRSEPPRLYVLTAEPPATDVPGIGGAAPSLGIGPVTLPGYLDRRGLVTRVEANRLESSRNDLWAEPLGTAFKGVLEHDLRLRLPEVSMRTFPWSQAAMPGLAVAVDVSRFEATAHGTVELRASWTLRRARDRALVGGREEVIVLAIAGTGAEATVATLSQALGRLADDIAVEVVATARR